MESNVDHSLERLRLAAAVVHVAGTLTLSMWPHRGPVVTVSAAASDPGAGDVGACRFRRLVGAAARRGRAPAEMPWLLSVGRLTVEGSGARHVGSGVVAATDPRREGSAPRWWWPSTLDADRVASNLRSVGAELLDDPAYDAALLGQVRVSAYADELLDVTVLALDAPAGDPHELRHADRVARRLAGECRVQELLGAAGVAEHREAH